MPDTPSETPATSLHVVRGIALGAVALVLTGLVSNYLTDAGPAGAPQLAWIVGYGTTMLIGWYYLIRPIDFSQRYTR